MRVPRWCLVVALLCGCANGNGDEEDGVIKKGDARVDTRDAAEEDTWSDEDTAIANDTGSATDSGSDTGADTGAADTMPIDMGPMPCPLEELEPNDTPSEAHALGTIDDCDGSGKTFTGVLSTSSDVDVLTFDGTDTFGCSVDPTLKITGPVKVCMKPTCKSGTTELKSCTKGTLMGGECCGSTDISIDLNCTGTTTDSTKLTITVRGDGSSLTCAAYTIAYRY